MCVWYISFLEKTNNYWIFQKLSFRGAEKLFKLLNVTFGYLFKVVRGMTLSGMTESI